MLSLKKNGHDTLSDNWEVVIGLEVHAQIISKTKLFSHAPNTFGQEPNTCVDLLDAGMPGALPVLNEFCVDQAIKTGFAINAEINMHSRFDRKNYFYPDLPNGYQISQFYAPIVLGGFIDIDLEDGAQKRIRVDHVHIEQDAGKSIHDIDPNATYVDLNRAGIGLMEIVSQPDMRSSDEAVSYMKKLALLLRYIGTCDCNMEEGSLRADANVSIHKKGTPLGTRAEIKNLNSFRFLKQAIDYEVERQTEILESGGAVSQETRLFNTKTGQTASMRSKEDAQDYRYFPEPDLPIVILAKERVENIRACLPELPDQKKKRYIEQLGLTPYDASILAYEIENANYFESCLACGAQLGLTVSHESSINIGSFPASMYTHGINQGIETHEKSQKNLKPMSKDFPKMVANWIITELFARLNKESVKLTDSNIKPQNLAKLIHLIENGAISGKIAKDVFAFMWDEQKDPAFIVEEKGLRQITDEGEIKAAIEEILSNNQDKVDAYKAGKEQLFGFFVGQTLKHFDGKASPDIVNKILKDLLHP